MKAHTARHRKRWKSRGLTTLQGKALLRDSKGLCAICGNPFGVKGAKLDHDHDTGLARGYLCNKCNLAIGLLGDTAESLGRAFAYLMRPPAAKYHKTP